MDKKIDLDLKQFEQPRVQGHYRYPVVEIFPAVQGEGQLIGKPTTFIRFGGCDYRCNWPVSASTKLLDIDTSRPVMARDVRPGMAVLGMQVVQGGKEPVPRVVGPFVPTIVTDVEFAEKPLYEVSFVERRAPVTVGPAHYFFLRSATNSGRARKVTRLRPGDRLRAIEAWRMRPGTPWTDLLPKNSQRPRQGDHAVVDRVTGGHLPGTVVAIQTTLGSYITDNGVLHKNCDSLFAVEPQHRTSWAKLTAQNILDAMQELEARLGYPLPRLITLSGGNPAIQPLEELLTLLRNECGFRFAMETQGTVNPEIAAQIDELTLSPKPPSSGMTTNYEQLDKWIEEAHFGYRALYSLKIVVFDDIDYAFAKELHKKYSWVPMYLQVGTYQPEAANAHPRYTADGDILESLRKLQSVVMQDPAMQDTAVLPQLHSILHGHRRGV